MLPPEIESIASDLRKRFREWILADVDGTALSDLLVAEEVVEEFVRRMGRDLVQDFVDLRSSQAKSGRGPCRCGKPTELHRRTEWTRETMFGPVVVSDPYTYCRECRASDRPLHPLLGTDRETWSLLVQEAAVDLASDESCGAAVSKLARHHPGVEMGRTTALRMLHDHGSVAREFIDAKLVEARQLALRPPRERGPGTVELEVEHDAGMIPVATLERIEVPEGEKPELTPVRGLPKRRKVARWEEVKAGLVQKPGETQRLYTLRPTDELEAAFQDLLALAVMKGWDEQTQVRGIADGAIHIRPRMEENFDAGDFMFILDRPHLKQHLSDAGRAMQPFSGLNAQTWANNAMDVIESGDASAVVAELLAAYELGGGNDEDADKELRLEAGYLGRNRDAVAYADYRKNGWSTASGEIESAHGSIVQARLKIAGAWWHPDHVDDILALRMLKANGWWDEYWQYRRDQWRHRAARMAHEHQLRQAA